jgi:hypothetical protein
MKHVGKMKNNGARIVVAYRTIPGDATSALVVGTGNLNESFHDALMNLVQDVSGQQANELADVLASRLFPDGSNMLSWLHTNGHLKKVPTNMVIMAPSSQASIQLDELNKLIAEQKGVDLEDLAVTDGSQPVKKPKKADVVKTTSQSVSGEEDVATEITPEVVIEDNLSPAQLRSKADALFKQAQQLRKEADAIDPPKRRTKKVAVEAE